LLRRYRLATGLTQEELAGRAGLSVPGLSALESGKRQTPYRHTVSLLVQALGLTASEAATLAAAVNRVRAPAGAGVPPAQGEDAAPPGTVLTLVPAPPGPHSNLPVQPTSFIGREQERAEVVALLGRAPLLTLTGSGGVGKTRLALAVAGDLVDAYPDGVWLVELAALAEPGLVPGVVAQVLGLREEVGRPLSATLTAHLKDKHLLLVLDNCEHLVAACAALASALLRACPHLRILATCREALEVAGEQRYRVPSLPVPDLVHLPPPERLADAAAVALFLARAQERRPDFVLTAQNAQAMALVCARLDGIPLAIELAAARVGSLSVEGIAARLDDRFHLLTGGARDALPRQRTLRAALDWSYDLLTESEQALLDRLSVFAGGWTLVAAEVVCSGDGVERCEVLDLLGSLVNKSLVQTEEVDGEVRYTLLETVRQYGQEQLAAAGGAAKLRDRHLGWYLTLLEESGLHRFGVEQLLYYDQLEREHDNLRAALRWAHERGAVEEGLRLAGVLGNFWVHRGYLGEGRAWLEDALAMGAGVSAVVRARALYGAGDLAFWQGDFGDAVVRLEQCLTLYRDLDNTLGIAAGLYGLGRPVERQGDFGRARALYEESLALCRAVGDPSGIGLNLVELGWLAHERGEYDPAVSYYEEALAHFRAAEYNEGVGACLSYLACVLERRGAYEQAVGLLEESLALWQAAGTRMGITQTMEYLGWVLLTEGEDARGMALLEESLARSRKEGDFWGVPTALHYLGWAAYRRGGHERAATLQEQALVRLRQSGYRWGIAWVLASLGCVVQARGEYEQAAIYLRESLQISYALGARGLLAEALEGMVWLAAAQGQAARAARLGGAAEALREALGAALHPVLHGAPDHAGGAGRGSLHGGLGRGPGAAAERGRDPGAGGHRRGAVRAPSSAANTTAAWPLTYKDACETCVL
jgi:non-specific serine/threonine protein kinase